MALNDTLMTDEARTWWLAELHIQTNHHRRDINKKDERAEEPDE